MLKITLIKIIFQIKIYNINISGKTIDNSNKHIIKKDKSSKYFINFM